MRFKIIMWLIIGIGLSGMLYAQYGEHFFAKHHVLSLPASLTEELVSDSLLPPPLRSRVGSKGAYLTVDGILNATNKQRKDNGGLPSLTINGTLNKVAEAKVRDMFEQQYFEHISPDGKGPADLAKDVGYVYAIVGENLALGNFDSNTALVQAWMDSPGHRANILNTRYQEIGIAVGKGRFEGSEVWLAVQSFGLPLSACPHVDDALRIRIAQNRAEIARMEKELEAKKQELETTPHSPAEHYNEKVAEFNNQVNTFNNLVDQTKLLVNQYNNQVQELNTCIEKK